jgi:CBS domain-containing protein
MANDRQGPDVLTRKWLAVAIVGASIVAIVAISAVAIALAGGSRPDTSRLVFSSVLPLLGTWVGTVLAFYFARENFQAATESTLKLAGIETATPVTRVMIREADFVAYDLGTGDRVEDVQLAAVRQRMQALVPPSRRLPIRNVSGAVLYVIHDSTLIAYADSVSQPPATLDKTIGNMLDDAQYKQLIEAIGFVDEKATVADARAVMVSVKNSNDVFVTANGKRDERAIGWLTNTLLAGVQ